MSNIKIITKAWIKVFRKLTTKEDKRRAEICFNCPNKKYSKYVDFIDDELINVKGYVCTKCSCPLISKIRSEDNCPLKKW